MSLQNLTLTTLRKTLPDSLIDDLKSEITSNLWICTFVSEFKEPISCMINSSDPIRSIIKNETFIRQLLATEIFEYDVASKEIFYIFGLRHELTWKAIQEFLSNSEIVLHFQNPMDSEWNFNLEISNIEPYDYSYQLNELEKSHSKVDYEKLIDFIETFSYYSLTTSWIKFYLMDDEAHIRERKNVEQLRKNLNRIKLSKVNFENLESYSEKDLRSFLRRIRTYAPEANKNRLIQCLKDSI